MDKISVFLSSTFKDMNLERTYLAINTFPQLRREYIKKGVLFSWVDLRWGIPDEDAEKGLVVPKCLKAIEECNPYFIGIIGDYYGTSLTQSEVDNLDLPTKYKEEILNYINDDDGISITEIEILHGVLKNPNAHACFFFKNTTKIHDNRLQRLISKIKNSGFPYDSYESIDDLGNKIHHYLSSYVPKHDSFSTPIERESILQKSILYSYIGDCHNSDEYEKLEQKHNWISHDDFLAGHVRREDMRMHIIVGDWGIGKSSYISYWINKEIEKQNNVVYYYVNSLSSFKKSSQISEYLVNEILRLQDYSHLKECLSDIEDSEEKLCALIKYICFEQKPLSIVLDGVQEIKDRTDSTQGVMPQIFNLLEDEPHPYVLTIYAGNTEDAVIQTIKKRFPNSEVQVLSGLSPSTLETLSQTTLNLYHKSLNDLSKIRSCQILRNPLILKRFLELLISCERHESLQNTVDDFTSSSSIETFIGLYYKRLSSFFEQGALIEMLKLLFLSKEGLTITEINTMLAANGYKNVPIGNIVTLLDDFLYYECNDKNEGIIYFRNCVARKAAHNCFENIDSSLTRRSMIKIFEDELSTPSHLIDRIHIVSELMHHFFSLGDASNLYQIVLDAENMIHASNSKSYIMYWSYLVKQGYSQIGYLENFEIQRKSIHEQLNYYRKVLGMSIMIGNKEEAYRISKSIFNIIRYDARYIIYINSKMDEQNAYELLAFLVKLCEVCAQFGLSCPDSIFESMSSLLRYCNDFHKFYYFIKTNLLRVNNVLACSVGANDMTNEEICMNLYNLVNQLFLKTLSNIQIPQLVKGELKILCVTSLLKIGLRTKNKLMQATLRVFLREDNDDLLTENELLGLQDESIMLEVAKWKQAQAEFAADSNMSEMLVYRYLEDSLSILHKIENVGCINVNAEILQNYTMLLNHNTDENKISHLLSMVLKYKDLV